MTEQQRRTPVGTTPDHLFARLACVTALDCAAPLPLLPEATWEGAHPHRPITYSPHVHVQVQLALTYKPLLRQPPDAPVNSRCAALLWAPGEGAGGGCGQAARGLPRSGPKAGAPCPCLPSPTSPCCRASRLPPAVPHSCQQGRAVCGRARRAGPAAERLAGFHGAPRIRRGLSCRPAAPHRGRARGGRQPLGRDV